MDEKPHKKLNVWQKAVEIARETYFLTEKFPTEEKFGLVQQMRRASISIASNIAEGAARTSRKEKTHFFVMARGSLSEIDTQIEIIKGISFAQQINLNDLVIKLEEVSRMLNGLIRKSREDHSDGEIKR